MSDSPFQSSSASEPGVDTTILVERLEDSRHIRPPGSHVYRWLAKRVAIAAASLIGLSIITFAATQVLPGNAAVQLLGRNANPENVAAIEKLLGLNHSIVNQYLRWGGGILEGNFGTSLASSRPSVSSVLVPAVSNSAVLVVISAVAAIALSLPLGVLAAARRGSVFDKAFGGFTFVFTAVPEFIVSLTLVMLFATSVFHLLPAISFIPPGTNPLSQPHAFVLPVVTLVLVSVPYLGRLVRGSMIDELDSEHVRMARLKGLSERRILFRHALPNALVPMIQGAAVVIGYMAGGIVVVENVFGFPGIGTLLLSAIQGRDVPTVQAACLALGSVYIVVNLVADVLVVLVSPRTRTAAA